MQRRCLIVLSTLLLIAGFLFAQNLPQPVGWVNDFAGVISSEYKDKLNSLISELEEKTSAEIAVVTVDSISPYGEIEYARLLFDNWKIGKKGKDNGVLVLLAIKERRWRIETGYGIEGILSDGLCGEIGRNYMVPLFKEGKYSEGLYEGVLAIANVVAKDAKAQISRLTGRREKKAQIPGYLIFSYILIPLFLWFILVGDLLLFLRGWLALIVLFMVIGVLSRRAPLHILFIYSFLILLFARWLFRKKIKKTHYGRHYRDTWGGFLGGVGGGFGGGGFGGGGFGGGGGGGGGAGGGF